MERHGRNLEGDADEHEHEADRQPYIRSHIGCLGRGGDRRIGGRSGNAIEKRRAVEQQAGRQRAQNKIFEARFARLDVIAFEGRDDIESQILQLKAEVESDEVVCGDHHQHAEGREQHQHGIFEQQQAGAAEIVECHQQRQRRGDENEDFEEPRQAVGDESTLEYARRSRAREDRYRRGDENADCQPRDGTARLLRSRREDTDHQQRHRADRKDQFRQYDVHNRAIHQSNPHGASDAADVCCAA